MIYQIRHYLKFLLKSTNQHGVHSPFVYQLVTKCFYDQSNFQEYTKIEDYRKALLKNKTQLISHIAKPERISKFQTKLLFRLVKYLDCNSILEIGASLGLSAQAMSLGNPKGQITIIGNCPDISQFSKDNFKQQKLNNIQVGSGDFTKMIQDQKSNTYDLVLFNHQHLKEATLQSFESLLPTIHNDTVFIFNNIYRSKSITESWINISQHPKVTVSIDCYHLGMIFFRSEQQKERFTIRL